MRRLFVLLILALTTPVLSWGLDFKVGNLKYSTLTETTVAVVGCGEGSYPDKVVEFIVPETVTYEGVTYTVTEIGDKACYNDPSTYGGEYITKKVELPKTITKIGIRAFGQCKALESPLVIPAAVTELGENCFVHCHKLTSITFEGDNIKVIPKSCFDQCWGLIDCKLPKSIVSIGERAFYACESLETIILPDGIETLESSLFGNCYKLKNIRLPKELKTINNSVFSYCQSLECLIFPEKLETIGTEGSAGNLFTECTKLKDIYFIGELPSIPKATKTAATWLSLNIKSRWQKTMNVYVKESLLDSYKEFFNSMPVGDNALKYQIPYSSTLKLSTYYREFDSDFHVAVGESNIKPFVATGYDSQKAYLTSIDNGIVPKECGVVIRNNTGNSFWYQIAEVQGNPQPAVNYLKGFCWEQTLNPTEEDGSVNYVLYNNEFCTFDNSGMLGYHKAYLQLPASAGSKQITMSFADEPSGIGEVEAGEEQKVYYNLSGMRVERPKKGVYVQNGKKIIFK